MNRVVALLPMKAHSARITGKNFRTFAGKPLFRWILDTLLSLDFVDRIVINTDARHLLSEHELVSDDRVLIRDRPAEICGDSVSMNRVLANDIEAVESITYLMTHTTNPLLRPATIREAYRRYRLAIEQGAADSLFSVNRHQTRFYRSGGTAVNHDPKNLVRTQELETWFEENSNLYLFSRASFRETSARIGRKPIMFETPKQESLDIDDESSWEFAELVALGTRQVAELVDQST